jgi:hypothetical protein
MTTRHEFLQQLHELIQPKVYLEIGVQHGWSPLDDRAGGRGRRDGQQGESRTKGDGQQGCLQTEFRQK